MKKIVIILGIVIFVIAVGCFSVVKSQIEDLKSAGYVETSLLQEATEKFFEKDQNINFGNLSVGNNFSVLIDNKKYDSILIGTKSDAFGTVTGYFEFKLLFLKKTFKKTFKITE